jgi:hypothetical protein
MTEGMQYPFCVDAGSVPVKTLAAQIWAFCAVKGSGRNRCEGSGGC